MAGLSCRDCRGDDGHFPVAPRWYDAAVRTTGRGLMLLALAVVLVASACAPESPRILGVSLPGDTRDPFGPYIISTAIRGVTRADRVEAQWARDGATVLRTVEGARASDDGELFLIGLPGQRAGSTVQFLVAVIRDGKVIAQDPPGGDAGPERLYSFRVLAREGACRADSDCTPGAEICADGACREFTGLCDGPGDTCPDGTACAVDRTPRICLVPARSCLTDAGCPTVEACDLLREICTPRTGCVAVEDCPEGEGCREDLGLCFAVRE